MQTKVDATGLVRCTQSRIGEVIFYGIVPTIERLMIWCQVNCVRCECAPRIAMLSGCAHFKCEQQH
jgi:hypothetical protein